MQRPSFSRMLPPKQGAIHELAPGFASSRRPLADDALQARPAISRCTTAVLSCGGGAGVGQGMDGGGERGGMARDAAAERRGWGVVGCGLQQGKTGKIVQVSACAGSSAAVAASGDVWVWGRNVAGQLGVPPLGDDAASHVPVKLAPLQPGALRQGPARQARQVDVGVSCLCVCVCVCVCLCLHIYIHVYMCAHMYR